MKKSVIWKHWNKNQELGTKYGNWGWHLLRAVTRVYIKTKYHGRRWWQWCEGGGKRGVTGARGTMYLLVLYAVGMSFVLQEDEILVFNPKVLVILAKPWKHLPPYKATYVVW